MNQESLFLKEAKRLHDLGFAILWLHPRSKRPIGNEWAKGERKSWEGLIKNYRDDFNVGVRLGSASQIGAAHLAVIDVDVKSSEKRHLKEALEALSKLTSGMKCPEVRSGRGNGSRHLYCLTEKSFKTWNPFSSNEMVKVLIPSKSPSKRDLSELSVKEIGLGIRLSRAWEISLYSDGRQVVLPPSVHPDTGKRYFWKERIDSVSSIPLLDFSNSMNPKSEKNESEMVEDFTVDETLDIRWLPDVSESIRKLICDGVWQGKKVSDRSAYLLMAATGLISSGLEKNGVLTVLTDTSTILGECAYEHAKTKSRLKAAEWLWNYTVKKVMQERDTAIAFQDKRIEFSKLGEKDVISQNVVVEKETNWRSQLELTKEGKIRSTLNNCKTILSNTCEVKNIIRRDEFANNDFYICNTPWRSKRGDAVVDADIVRIKFFCSEQYGIEFGDNTINQTLLEIADANRFHPVRDYLRNLKWDGEHRIETWLKDFAGADGPDDYLRAVSRKVLVALVKRVMEPGCKFDHVLILEGDQGVGKSTLLRNLVGAKWFTDQPMVIGEKDTVLTMQAKWLVELGELSSLNRSEVEAMKAFITQMTDRIRAPYGKRVEEFPRQSIFVGSTNLGEYLKDETGNRRFWPVRCLGIIDFEGIKEVRDQLFAEAVAFYNLDEPLYLESTKLNQLAQMEQTKRGEIDEWHGAIADVVFGELFPRNGFEMRQIAAQLDQFGAHRLDKSDQARIGKILRNLGFERFQETISTRRKLWRQKEAGTTLTSRNQLAGSTNLSMESDFY